MKRKMPKATTTTLAYERALAAPLEPRYVLRLYVTGMTPRSSRAIANAKAICEQHLEGRYDLRVIDVYQEPVLISQDRSSPCPCSSSNCLRPCAALSATLRIPTER
jgi:circadian clock protein KaiB